MLTTKEAADRLVAARIPATPDGVASLARSGALPGSSKPEGKWQIPEAAIDAYIQSFFAQAATQAAKERWRRIFATAGSAIMVSLVIISFVADLFGIQSGMRGLVHGKPDARDSSASPSPVAPDQPEIFPLLKGSYWTYEGIVIRGEIGKPVQRDWETVTMEVTDVIQRGHVTGAVVKGHPWDLGPEGKKRRDYLIVKIDPGKCYLVGDDRAQKVKERLLDNNDLLIGLVLEPELFLQLPLTAGSKFCEADQIARQADAYCWVVTESKPAKINRLENASQTNTTSEYQLAYRTAGSATILAFVPGIGLTSFEYEHAGTILHIVVMLKDYRIGQ